MMDEIDDATRQERLRYYQRLKLECANVFRHHGWDAETTIGEAKKLFCSITEERWGTQPTEEPPDVA